ncbi:MAG TPA: ABC transporter permease [Opitutaceae bacterium]|jgi:lipopolysaccharide transport system permease protein
MSNSAPIAAQAALSRKRDLWWQFTVRAVESRYRGSYLGILWAVLNPLLMLTIYFVVFGIILGGHFRDPKVESLKDFAIAMFLSLTLYQLLADTLCTGPLLITTNPNLVKKVVFPLEVLPAAQTAGLWFNLAIGLVLALGGWLLIGNSLTLTGLLMLPVIIAPLLLLCAGLSWLLAGLGVFFRDLAQAMPFLAQVIMYSSAVFFPASRIPASVWWILKWNPFLQTVVLSRQAVLWHGPISLHALGYTYAAGIASFAAGRWVFVKLRPAFADVL